MKMKFWLPLVALGFFAPAIVANNLATKALHVTTYSDRETYINHALKVAKDIADEGTVLLKNDGFLPLKKGSKISVVGKSSVNLTKYAALVQQGIRIEYIDLYKSLTDAGYETNQALAEFYKNNLKSGNGHTLGNSGWRGISELTIGETPIESYDSELIDTFAQYNDAAIFTISRWGSEGVDSKTSDTHDSKNEDFLSNRHSLQMSKNEEDLYNLLRQKFNHIIILLDSSVPFECDVFNKDSKVSAIIWNGGNSGDVGLATIGKILNGTLSPSGKTVDTWTRDFTKDPSFKNFADNSQTNLVTSNGVSKYVPQDTMYTSTGEAVKSYGSIKDDFTWEDEINKVPEYGVNGVRPSAFVKYEEDIYTDYRYYETVYDDLMAKTSKASADQWYDSAEGVVYPFGYGLSYTKFAKEIINFYVDLSKNNVTAKVKVTNVGKVTGKEAVQLYLKAPYTNGGIEKASEVLCAFGKTKDIKPGDCAYVNLKFNLQDFASYDAYDVNQNGFKGYELEKGDYKICLKDDAHKVSAYTFEDGHQAVCEKTFTISKDLKFENDLYSKNKIENQFTSDKFSFYDSLPTENDVKFVRLTRKNGLDASTIGDNSIASRTLKANSRVEEYLTHEFTIADIDVEAKEEYIDLDVHFTKEQALAKGFRQCKSDNPNQGYINISEIKGVPMDDEAKWNNYLNQFKYSELCNFVSGHMSSMYFTQIGLKSSSERSGAGLRFSYVGFPGVATLAATFNVELAAEYGDCIGEEGNLNSTYGFWSPYATIRRSPFAGRSLDFYSSDPLVAGKMVANSVKAAKAKGLVCYVNGLGLGNQEKNREGGIVYASEQAIREIYLKSFQYAVQEGGAVAVTTSYQRVGLMEAANNYHLLNNILRKEWGFKGFVFGDMTHAENRYVNFSCFENINYRILSGMSDQMEPTPKFFVDNVNCTWDDGAFDGKGAPVFEYGGRKYESYTWWNAIRNSAKERLYLSINYGDISGNGIASSDKIEVINVSGADSVDGNRFVIQTNKNIDFEVKLNDELEDCKAYLDSATPLPDGIFFKDNRIMGSATESGVTRFNILAEYEGTVYGKTVEIEVLDFNTNSIPIAEPKGCSASIGSGLGIFAATSILAGAILLVINRKRKLA